MDVIDLLRKQPIEDELLTVCRVCGELRPCDALQCPHCDNVGRILTLSNWGPRLPVGILYNEQKSLLKEFEVEKVDWIKERNISNNWTRMSSRGSLTVIDYVLCVLSECIKTLGGTNFLEHSNSQRMLVLREMFVGDVFYMYIYLRVMSLGKEYVLKGLDCPECNNKFDFPVDLTTTEISVIDDIKNIYSKITLEDGFELMGGLRKEITVKPITFNSLIGIKSNNEAEIWAKTIQNSVIEIEGAPPGTILTEKEISTFSKCDMNIVSEEIDLVGCGPNWDVEVVCDKCHATYIETIDWQYSNFFRLASRSKQRGRRLRR